MVFPRDQEGSYYYREDYNTVTKLIDGFNFIQPKNQLVP